MTKTLVIHPHDPSTDFLSPIYEGEDWTVVRTNISNSVLRRALKAHDRIIMLGHGCPQGLLGHGKLFVDARHVQFLRGKDLVCIWCNADQFVEKYGLSGFYTGMIISEYEEALYCSVAGFDAAQIEQSNTLFAAKMAAAIRTATPALYAKTHYHCDTNPIIKFNQQNIYQR